MIGRGREVVFGWGAIWLATMVAGQTVDQPPIYNDQEGSPPSCTFSGSVGICGTACRCSPTIASDGWDCEGCPGATTGRWPLFSNLFYVYAPTACANFNFNDLPLLDLPSGLQAGTQSLVPNSSISLTPIARLDRIREIPLECTQQRDPVEAAARYQLSLSGAGSPAACDGAVFFVTAEFNPTLFEVTLHGKLRAGASYQFNEVSLSPFQPRLIVGSEVATSNALRYPDLIAVTGGGPAYVRVGIKPGRSPREAGSQSVRLRVHSFNWGGNNSGTCLAVGNCPEGYRFESRGTANVQVFQLELPPDWCPAAAALEADEALPVSSLSDGQRRAAEFDGFGAKAVNDLTADLPVLRVGHGRFRVGRTLAESLGNDAWWHTNFGTNQFVSMNAFGVWCALSDLPGWTSQQVGSELVVTDPCEGVTYHYQRPDGGAVLGETALKLSAVKRGGAMLRSYTYAGGGVLGNLVSQIDSDGDQINYAQVAQGSDTALTITGLATGGGMRIITAVYNSSGYLKSATWSNGGPARQYEFIVNPGNLALDGRIDRVLDGVGNVLLNYEYDSQGRLIETNRGSGPTLQVVNKHTYINTAGGGQMFGNTSLVNQCFVDATRYQATVRTFDRSNRVIEVKEFHDLQTLPVTSAAVPAFTGPSSTTMTKYRGPEESLATVAGIAGSHFTTERVWPSGLAAEYTVFDTNFNIIRTWVSTPGLVTYNAPTAINEKRLVHQQFSGIWQTTQEIDVARNLATTVMGYDGAGFMTSRTMPSVSPVNSGSGLTIAGRTETFTYDPVNKKRVLSETRNDGQNGTINVTNTFDPYDYPSGRTELGICDTRSTLTSSNAFGQTLQQTDVDGYVTAKVFDALGHPNTGSGLLLGQYTYATGNGGTLLQQTRYFYFTSGANRGRLERIEIADHEGPFSLDGPTGWQTTTFAYDVYGRVLTKSVAHTVTPGVQMWTYAYDRQDRAIQFTYPDGAWVRNTREGRGLLTREEVGSGGDVTAGTGGTVVLTNSYAYNANGKLIDRVNRTAAELPDHTTYEYDAYNRRTRQTHVDDGSVGYSIVTNYEYNTGNDLIRRYIREGLAGPIREDVRTSIDELGRAWKESILKDPSVGLNPSVDRILTTTFDVRGNERETRVTDGVVGAAVNSRVFTCFDLLDSTSQVLNNSETAVTDVQTDRRGNMTVIVDPVGNRTEHDYDALSQRLVTRFFERIGGQDVLQLRSEVIYTSREQRARHTQFSAAGQPLDQQRWEYDALGFQKRWARLADPASDGPLSTTIDRVVDNTSDGLGRSLSRTVFDGGMSRTTTWSYDSIGRLQAITHPVAAHSESLAYLPLFARLQSRTMIDSIGSRMMNTTFDPFGRLRSETAVAIAPAVAVTTTYAYDGVDRRTRVTDPLGYLTVNAYDGLRQLTSVVEDSGGADQRTVTFTYTQKGDLLTQTANDGEGPQVTSFTHDRAGRRTRLQHPDASAELSTYDLAGRQLTRQAEDGFITHYAHNWRGQVLRKRQTSAGGPILESFTFDPLGRMTAAAVGDVPSAVVLATSLYGNGTDVNGDAVADPAFVDTPVSVTQIASGVSKSVLQSFNTAGERNELVYPAGADLTLTYAYDAFGQVRAIDREGQRLANYVYAGREVTSRQVRTTFGPGETWIETAWSRPDQLRRAKTITNRVRTGSINGVGGVTVNLATFDNLFDAASNLDTQTTANHPVAAENGVVNHGYDRLHRLTLSDYPNTANDESWNLDDLSNWVSHVGRDGSNTSYTDNVLNQYTAIGGQTSAPLHDAKGNLVRNELGYGFSCDFENRLTRVFTDNAPANGVYDAGEAVHAQFVVDPLGRRVAVTAEGVTKLRFYDPESPGLVLAEYASDDIDTAQRVYVNGPTYLDEKILTRVAGPTAVSARLEFYYLLKDLYTVASLVNETGTTVEGYAYDGYGGVTVSRSAVNVVAVGPRYLAVTPAAGDTHVALRVTSPDWPCLSKYVGLDGILQASPVFQAPAAWGTVYVRGQDIVADTPYDVQTDNGMTLSAPARARTWHWADATNDGFANVADVLCILDRFAGLPGGCSRQATDLLGTTPNTFTNVDDALAALDAFAGIGYQGPNPCAAGDVAVAGDTSATTKSGTDALAPFALGREPESDEPSRDRQGAVWAPGDKVTTFGWTHSHPQTGTTSNLAQSPNPYYFTGQRLDAWDPPDPALPSAPDNAGLLLYDYKARAYDPKHGRFLQRDPAEFLDGYNLYEYATSRPSVLTDPTGKFSLPEFNLSTAIRQGLKAFNTASAARDVLEKARLLASGASLQSILLSLVVEATLDKLGGDVFERALKLVQRAGQATRRAVFSNTAGKLAETAAGIQGPKALITIDGRLRVPDQLVDGVFLRDVKFRSDGMIALTGQLDDFIKFAGQQEPGFKIILTVPKGTTAVGKLAEYVEQGLVILDDTLP